MSNNNNNSLPTRRGRTETSSNSNVSPNLTAGGGRGGGGGGGLHPWFAVQAENLRKAKEQQGQQQQGQYGGNNNNLSFPPSQQQRDGMSPAPNPRMSISTTISGGASGPPPPIGNPNNRQQQQQQHATRGSSNFGIDRVSTFGAGTGNTNNTASSVSRVQQQQTMSSTNNTGPNRSAGNNNNNNNDGPAIPEDQQPPVTVRVNEVEPLRDHLIDVMLTPILNRALRFRISGNDAAAAGVFGEDATALDVFAAKVAEVEMELDQRNKNNNQNKNPTAPQPQPQQQTTTQSRARSDITTAALSALDTKVEDVESRTPIPIEVDLLKTLAAAPGLGTPLATRPESTFKALASEIANIAECVVKELKERLVAGMLDNNENNNNNNNDGDDADPFAVPNNNDAQQQPQQEQRHNRAAFTGCLKRFVERRRLMIMEANAALIEQQHKHALNAARENGDSEGELVLLTPSQLPKPDPLPHVDIPFIVVALNPYRTVQNLCLRPTHTPPCFAVASHDLSFSRHNNRLVQIKGTVIKHTPVRLVTYKAVFECGGCHSTREIYSSLATRQQSINRPYCTSCKKDKQKMVLRGECFKDYVECWIQRQGVSDDAGLDDEELFGDKSDFANGGIMNNNAAGTTPALGFSAKLPRSILVAIEDELTRAVYPGLMVQVTGVCVARWNNMWQGQTPEIQLMVYGLNVTPVSTAQLTQANPSSLSARQQSVLMNARKMQKIGINRKRGGGANNNGNNSNDDQMQLEQDLIASAKLDCMPIVSLLARLETCRSVVGPNGDQSVVWKQDGPLVGIDEPVDVTTWLNHFIEQRLGNDPLMLVEGASSIRDANAERRQEYLEGGGRHRAAGGAALPPSRLMISRELLRTKLVTSVAPQLCGRFAERLSILLTCIGGVRRRADNHQHHQNNMNNNHNHNGNGMFTNTTTASDHHQDDGASLSFSQQQARYQQFQQQQQNQHNDTSVNSRSNIHVLFVGDPATGKSQLLLAANAIAVVGVYAMGVGTTSAGLTAAASKDSGEWSLDPGALVLSNGGVCVIDELRTVSAADRNSLHEAMEQQSISVAKAGMCATLRTDCSVVAACNPMSKSGKRRGSEVFNPTAQREIEVGVGAPLLSRFDLIFAMFDNGRYDDIVASHILQLNTVSDDLLGISREDQENNNNNNNGSRPRQQQYGGMNGNGGGGDDDIDLQNDLNELLSGEHGRLGAGSGVAFTVRQLREYCAQCRQRCHQQKSFLFFDRQLHTAAGARAASYAAHTSNATTQAAHAVAVAAAAARGQSAAPLGTNTNASTHVNSFNHPAPNSLFDLSLDNDAAALILAYYNAQRARAVDYGGSYVLNDPILVTIRLLESLVRLTQAHACLIGRFDTCTVQDAAMAVFLTEQSARSLKLRLFPESPFSDVIMKAATESERERLLGQIDDLPQQVAATMPYTCSNADRWFLNCGRSHEWAQKYILDRLIEVVRNEGARAVGQRHAAMMEQQRQQQMRNNGFASVEQQAQNDFYAEEEDEAEAGLFLQNAAGVVVGDDVNGDADDDANGNYRNNNNNNGTTVLGGYSEITNNRALSRMTNHGGAGAGGGGGDSPALLTPAEHQLAFPAFMRGAGGAASGDNNNNNNNNNANHTIDRDSNVPQYEALQRLQRPRTYVEMPHNATREANVRRRVNQSVASAVSDAMSEFTGAASGGTTPRNPQQFRLNNVNNNEGSGNHHGAGGGGGGNSAQQQQPQQLRTPPAGNQLNFGPNQQQQHQQQQAQLGDLGRGSGGGSGGGSGNGGSGAGSRASLLSMLNDLDHNKAGAQAISNDLSSRINSLNNSGANLQARKDL